MVQNKTTLRTGKCATCSHGLTKWYFDKYHVGILNAAHSIIVWFNCPNNTIKKRGIIISNDGWNDRMLAQVRDELNKTLNTHMCTDTNRTFDTKTFIERINREYPTLFPTIVRTTFGEGVMSPVGYDGVKAGLKDSDDEKNGLDSMIDDQLSSIKDLILSTIKDWYSYVDRIIIDIQIDDGCDKE